MADPQTLARLRSRIESLERRHSFAPGPRSQIRATARAEPVLGFGIEALDHCLAGGGLGFGAHQIAGEPGGAAGAFVVGLLARLDRAASHRSGRGASRLLALVVQERSAEIEDGGYFGPGLHALGLAPDGVALIVARDGRQALRIADEALRSASVRAVVVELRRGARQLDLTVSQRFSVSAQDTKSMAFLLTPDLDAASAAATRWQVCAVPGLGSKRWVGPPTLQLDLVRSRHGRPGRWIVEWNSDEQAFQIPTALPAPVARAPVHRPGVAGASEAGFAKSGPAAGFGGDGFSPGAGDQGERRAASAGAG